MAVTTFKFPPLFRKPKNVKNPKRLGVRAVVGDSSNNFLLTLQDILNPVLSFIFEKNASNKIIFQIFAFLIIAAGLYKVHFWSSRLAPVLKTIFHQCVIIFLYMCSYSYSDGSVLEPSE